MTPTKYDPIDPISDDMPTITKGSIPNIILVGSKIGKDRMALSAVRKPNAKGKPAAL